MQQNSYSKISKEAKKSRGINAAAFRIAKEKDDLLYKKSVKFKGLWQKVNEQIAVKYKSLARQRFLESQSKKSRAKSKAKSKPKK